MPDCAPFLARRQQLLSLIGDGVALIPTAPEVVRNRDTTYPYRPDSYFWYLSGFPEPESVIVLTGPSEAGHPAQSLLFCREKHEEREIWDGFRYGPEAAAPAFGFDAAFPIEQLDEKLAQLLEDRSAIWYAIGQDAAWDVRVNKALNAVRQQVRAGKRAPHSVHDLRSTLDAMRLVKDDHEIQIMRRAAAITSDAHRRAMLACMPGLPEYVLEAEITHEFQRRGARFHAYTPIVAGGSNACTLHYINNDQDLPDGGLVLIDAGCELEGYAADITRTFPVNGRFTPAQRDCYEIVLTAQEAAIAAIAPGQHFMQPHEAALRVLVQGMCDLRLLKGTVDGLIENGDYKRFYMHRTGHWLGLDVHDAGDYRQGSQWTTLAPGMVLTVEPGLYIRPAADIPPELCGIGIRIEDDALVTDDGCDIYTSAPKTVGEIEAVMQER